MRTTFGRGSSLPWVTNNSTKNGYMCIVIYERVCVHTRAFARACDACCLRLGQSTMLRVNLVYKTAIVHGMQTVLNTLIGVAPSILWLHFYFGRAI